MEIHVLSTLAYENKKEKKGNPPSHDRELGRWVVGGGLWLANFPHSSKCPHMYM